MTSAPEPVEGTVEYWKAVAVDEIATCVVRYPPTEYWGHGVRKDYKNQSGAEPTPEQVELVRKSGAYNSVCKLIESAHAQQGSPGACQVVSFAVRFLRDSGMIYRLRVMSLERDATNKREKKKIRVCLDNMPAIFPSDIGLWGLPQIEFGSRGDGWNSMECECATDFYRTGIRCVWAEKMLLEALVCAGLYDTIKYAKINPHAWTGRIELGMETVCQWAYHRTRGEDPKYSILIRRGRAALSIAKIIVLALVVWLTVTDYARTSSSWWHLFWLQPARLC
jgi:hypothetical protein